MDKFIFNLNPLITIKNLKIRENLVYQAIRLNRFKYISVIFFGLLANLFEFLFLVNLPEFIENLFYTNQSTLNEGLFKILIVILWSIFALIFRYSNNIVCAQISKDLSRLLTKSITSLSFNKFDALGKNKILALATINLDLVFNAIIIRIPIIINFIFSILVGIYIIFENIGFNTFYLLVFSVFLIANFVNLTKNYALKFGRIKAKKTEEIYQYTNFFLDSIKEIFIQKSERFFSYPLSNSQYKKTLAEGKSEFISFIPRETIQFIFYLILITLGMINSSIEDNDILKFLPSIATLLIIAQRLPTLTNRVYKIFFSIVNTWPILKEYNLYDINIQNEKSKNKSYIDKNLRSIILEKTYIGHTKKNPLCYIEYLNIKVGSSLIIFGRSGSGKTTMVETILGLRKPLKGNVLFLDDKNKVIHDFRSISYVPQSINLPANNVLDSLSFTNPCINNFQKDEKIKKNIKRTLEICKIWDEFIFSFEDLRKPLGNGCLNLSGGQRQRLAIARSLLQNKQLLVLDEATSGLDKKTEAEIIRSILDEYKNTTIIAISHSSQLIEFFENVYNFEKNIQI